MADNYFLFYLEASVVCIVIFGILLVKDRIRMNRQEKQIVFDHALIAHILYFVTDIFWAGMIAGRIERTHLGVAIVNYANFVLLSAIAYEWSMFAAISERLPILGTKRGRLLFRLPIAVMSAVTLAAYLIAPHFWVSASGELNTLYYPMMLVAPLIYVVASCILSLRQARRTEDPSEHALFLMIGLYPLGIVLFGVIQLAYLDAPMFCFGSTIMMLFFYIRSMADQISLDPLTKLSNRGQLLRYAAQESAHRREEGKTYVVMIDANDFKQINDTYGHAEGDRALILIAEALKTCARGMRHAPFLCRYGGDEFALIVHAEQPLELERMFAELQCCLGETEALYSLSVSVGYDEWNTGAESFQDCLQRADEKLYDEKRRRKQRIQSAS